MQYVLVGWDISADTTVAVIIAPTGASFQSR